jgi:hypothetical protein
MTALATIGLVIFAVWVFLRVHIAIALPQRIDWEKEDA